MPDIALDLEYLADSMASFARQLGVFDRVVTEEDETPQVGELFFAVSFGGFELTPELSGLNTTSARVDLMCRIALIREMDVYTGMHRRVWRSSSVFLTKIHEALALGGVADAGVMNVDLLGASGQALRGDPINSILGDSGQLLQGIDVSVPIMVADIYSQTK